MSSSPCSHVDNSQRAADTTRTNALLAMINKKVSPVLHELEQVRGRGGQGRLAAA